uniref:uncharacterized protein LOC120329804 n=1 Tax=Styela clava TaxID=7725 RepID=UPI001939E156|nr:uncharacterized protein LOC120329804 [Styela clava]
MICTRQSYGRLLCTGLYFFLCGVEYAVILPTLNGYLISLDGPTGFLGIIMSSFSLTGLLSAPIYGRIADKTGANKMCAIISNIFEIIGNFMYFVGGDYRILWGARLISGVGTGAGSSYFGMISKTTTTKQRTGVLSMLGFMRNVGMLTGPGFNLFLSQLDFKLGPFDVNEFSSPGLFMTGMWTIHTILVMLLFKDVQKDFWAEVSEPTRQSNNGMLQNSEHSNERTTSPEIRIPKTTRSFRDEFLRQEVLVCLLVSFMSWVALTGFESAATPISLLFFGWGGISNSFMFCAGGAAIIFVYAVIGVVNRKLTDRFILLAGCSGGVLCYSIFTVYSTVLYFRKDVENPDWLLSLFWVDWIILTMCFPLIIIPMMSLYSKITSTETQSFNQGVLLMFAGAGRILGPLWSAPMVTEKRLPILGGLVLILMFVAVVLICTTFKKLVPRDNQTQTNGHTTNGNALANEKTPLLNIDKIHA